MGTWITGAHGPHGKPPPQCRWGAFENPQFKWVRQALEETKFLGADFGTRRV